MLVCVASVAMCVLPLCCCAAGDNPENDAARIEQLLRLGAHAILQGAGEGAACGAGGGVEAAGEDKGFAAEDIEQVRHTRWQEVVTWMDGGFMCKGGAEKSACSWPVQWLTMPVHRDVHMADGPAPVCLVHGGLKCGGQKGCHSL